MKKIAFVLLTLSMTGFGLVSAPGCEGGGEGEGEGEGEDAGEGEGEGGEGEGEAGEGEGEGGEGEGEGEEPGDDRTICFEECADNDDCQVGGQGGTFECVNSRCTPTAEPPPPCTTDEACTAQFSGWTTDCTTNAECVPSNVCVDVDGGGTGAGKCAGLVPAAGNCFGLAILTVNDINGTPAEVCGNEFVCGDNGACQAPPCVDDADCTTPGFGVCRADGACVQCESNDDCADGDLTACNEVTGTCGCANDGECAGNAAGEFCIVDSGTCGCAGNDDCSGNPLGDICTEGSCGCTAVADCNGDTTFDGTSYVCESFGG